ncbi:MAG TPA: hypothetical protein VD788_01200, partial [Candidatus Polarisedimenticolaceae bacterium]|nr:hypothetical protein [Candidatus Polarisedimenticolaceae bacterium]
VILVLGVTAVTRATAPPAQIAVSPSKLELVLRDRPATETLTLMNLGDEQVEIDVAVANWDLDQDNRVRLLEPDEQSLDQWMVINPLHFVLPPGKSQAVRFSIRPRVAPVPGEHRAMIYFNQVLPATNESVVRVRFSVGVAIYAHAGEPTRDGTLNDVMVVSGSNPPVARLDVSSVGSAHVRVAGQYAIYPASSYPGTVLTSWSPETGPQEIETPAAAIVAGALPSKPVLPRTRRQLVLQTFERLAPGEYVLDLNGELHGRPIDLAVPFTIGDPRLVAGSGPD